MTNIKIVESVSLKDTLNINSILWNYRNAFNVNSIFLHNVANMKIVENVKRHFQYKFDFMVLWK